MTRSKTPTAFGSMDDITKIFTKFDKNGDGKISCNEVVENLSELGTKISQAEVQSIMQEFDKDGDGYIDLDEFVDFIQNGGLGDSGGNDGKELRDAFYFYSLDFNTMAPEMFQQPLQPLDPSKTPPPSSSIDLESQLPVTQAQTSLALAQEISQAPETQPPHFTAVNSEIWLQIPQTQAPQPHSSMEIELLPPTPQRPSPVINAQQINGVTVNQISLEWPNIIMAFCFEAAIQIALQYEKTQQSKLPLAFYLRSLSILLTFVSLLSSQLISKKFPGTSKVLEKVAIFLATFAFFTTIATPLALPLS